MSALAAWVRRTFPWSDSRQAWLDRSAVAGLLAGALALVLLSDQLSAAAQVLLLYLVGTWTSVVAGRLADRRGRWLVLGAALPIAVTGLLLTVPHALVLIVIGVGLLLNN